jgi:hypothetical protein
MADEQEYIARFESAEAEAFAAILHHPTDAEDKALRLRLGAELYQRLRSLALRRSVSRSARKTMGNVVLIHCFMGSNLSTVDRAGRSEQIWIDARRLMDGQFERLRLRSDGRTQHHPEYAVNVTGMMKRQYGELLLSLSENWNVRAFTYDWRKDVRLAAAQLEAQINQWFDDNEPIHIVAHGEGGNVARSFIKHNPDRWQRMFDEKGDGRRGGRLIMLGTPNHGSYVIPQVMTGLSHLVTELDMLHASHERASVLSILNSFVGLYQMLPSPVGRPQNQALYHAETYETLNLPISRAHLENAERQHEDLKDIVDHERMIMIIGDNKLTVGPLLPDMSLNQPKSYSVTRRGDGYVTHDLSLLTGADGKLVSTYYLEELHGNLASNNQVLSTIDDLLETGRSALLPRLPYAMTEEIDDDDDAQEDHAAFTRGLQSDLKRIEVMLGRMRSRDVRVNGGGAYIADEQRKVEDFLTRDILCYRQGEQIAKRTRPLVRTTVEIGLELGSIAEIHDALPADAIAVGHYKGVRPYATMQALDASISRVFEARSHSHGGPPCPAPKILKEYIERGLIRGELGQPFFLPDPRPATANGPGGDRLIVVVGMGLPGRFGAPELTVLARELCWSLGRLGKNHLATVLIGAGKGNLPIRQAITAWLRGIRMAVVGSRDDEQHHLKRITFVELDPRKIVEIDRVIYEESRNLGEDSPLKVKYARLTAAQLDELEQKGEQRVLEEWRKTHAALRRRDSDADIAPTRVTLSLDNRTYRFGAITEAASIPEREIPLDPDLVMDANDELAAEWDIEQQRERGRFLAGLLVPSDLREQIFTPAPLVMVLDETTARIHWEMVAQADPTAISAAIASDESGSALPADDQVSFPREAFLGTSRGFTRQLRSTLAPPDAPPPPRRLLRVLVIADPAADAHLPGAEEEGAAVADLFETFNSVYSSAENRVEVVRLFGPREATRTKVLRYLMTRSFDVLHFAGHCTYDQQNPAASGWIFTNGERLTASEMNRIDRVPSFVFSNACESGITPDRSEERSAALAPTFAESFFARGVTNFVCTAWPIGDIAARTFALTLYSRLLGLESDPARVGRYQAVSPVPMHIAMCAARSTIAMTPEGARTWGAYQHYGNPYYRFFDPTRLHDDDASEAPRSATAPPKVRVRSTKPAAKADPVADPAT